MTETAVFGLGVGLSESLESPLDYFLVLPDLGATFNAKGLCEFLSPKVKTDASASKDLLLALR